MKIMLNKSIIPLAVGLLLTSCQLIAAKDNLETIERKPIIVLESPLYLGGGQGKGSITNRYGFRNPAFVLYEDGLVILKKGNDLHSVQLNRTEMEQFLDGFDFGDKFLRLADRIRVTRVMHPPINTLYYLKKGQLERTIRVFGNLNSNEEDRSATPRAFLDVYDQIRSFDHKDIQLWQPEYFVIWVSPTEQAGPVSWPKGWPDMNHPSTKKDPNFEDKYLMYLNGTHIDEFERLYSDSGNQSVLINNKAWFLFPLRHSLPAEDLWLNPAPYPQITYSKSGNFYAKSIAEDDGGPFVDNRRDGKTFVYQVVEGKDELLDSYDWYALSVELEGRSLVRLGRWAKGQQPNEDDLAIVFYHAGQTLKEYSTLDIVDLGYEDKQNIEIMGSSYKVLGWPIGFQHIDSSHYSFDVKTYEETILSFDPLTGELIKKVPKPEPNEIFDFKVVKETDDTLDIEVECHYNPQEEDWANLSIGVLRQGKHLGFTGYVPARLVPGKNKALLKMSASGRSPECFTSDEIEVTMYRKKGYDFLPDLAVKRFPYKKSWVQVFEPFDFAESAADRGSGPGYGRIGEVRVVRETHNLLELEVHYVYDRQGSRFVQLGARTRLAAGSPDHDKNIAVHLEPGFNTVNITIERSLMAPVEYQTDRINMSMVGNILPEPSFDSLSVRETFIYEKTWSKFPIIGPSKPLPSQPIPRVKKGELVSGEGCS